MLIVTFGLEGMTEAEFHRGCDEESPAFAGIPGLIAKVWLAGPGHHAFGDANELGRGPFARVVAFTELDFGQSSHNHEGGSP